MQELPINDSPAATKTLEAPQQDSQITQQQNVLKDLQGALNTYINKLNDSELSRRSLKRLLMNLAIHPLNKDELHFSYPEEKELFELGAQIEGAKFLLTAAAIEAKEYEKSFADEQSQQGGAEAKSSE